VDEPERIDLWKEASRKLAWAVLSTFPVADREKVRRWARGVATGWVKRYTTGYDPVVNRRAAQPGIAHKQHPIDKQVPSTDNGRAVEGMRPVRVDGVFHMAPATSGLPFATAESLWVRERVRIWSQQYGRGVLEEVS